MSNLIFPLLAGHLIADFWLQPKSLVQLKRGDCSKSGMLTSFILAIFIGFGLKNLLGI